MERTADELDMAADLQQRANDDGLARVRLQLVQSHPDFDGVHCIEPDCGEELPAVRIAYKRVRCAACQTEVERREKLGRRA